MTRCFDDIHILKANLEVTKRSFYFTGAMELNSLSRYIKSKETFIEFLEDTKGYFLSEIRRAWLFFFFFYIF